MANTVDHIVLLKTTRAFTTEEKDEIIKRIEAIPGVLSMAMGQNYTSRALEYTVGIVVRLESKEAEAAYQTHPEHVSVRNTLLKPLITKGTETTPPILAVDYEWCDKLRQRSWTDTVGGKLLLFASGVAVGCVFMGRLR